MTAQELSDWLRTIPPKANIEAAFGLFWEPLGEMRAILPNGKVLMKMEDKYDAE